MASERRADHSGQRVVEQIAGRDVDRHREFEPFRAPLRQLAEGSVQHALRQWPDEAAALGDVDEDLRVDEAALGVMPASESLDTDDLTAGERGLRLVLHEQLATSDVP